MTNKLMCTRGLRGDRGAHTPIPEKFKLVKLGPILENKIYHSDPTHPWKQLPDLRMLHGVLKHTLLISKRGKIKCLPAYFFFTH